MKTIIFLFLFLIALYNTVTSQAPDPEYKMMLTQNYVQSKNYYLLGLLQQLPEVNKLIREDDILAKVTKDKKNVLISSLRNCGAGVACYFENIKFSDEEIKIIGDRLENLFFAREEMQNLVKQHLIPSGCYILYANIPHEKMLRNT